MPRRTPPLPMAAAAPVATKSVKLAWDFPSDTNGITGYRIYQGGQSGNYTNHFDVGKTNFFSVGGLLPKATYFFVGTSLSVVPDLLQSNEVNYRVPATRVKLVTQQSAWLAGQWSTIATNYDETDAPSAFYRIVITTEE